MFRENVALRQNGLGGRLTVVTVRVQILVGGVLTRFLKVRNINPRLSGYFQTKPLMWLKTIAGQLILTLGSATAIALSISNCCHNSDSDTMSELSNLSFFLPANIQITPVYIMKPPEK